AAGPSARVYGGSRRPTGRRVTDAVALRAPHLYQSLRAFCLAAFSVERGAELPFAFEEHPTRQGPSLYEYRPLVRGFVEEQAPTLRRLPDTRNAIDDLRREPAAAIIAPAPPTRQEQTSAALQPPTIARRHLLVKKHIPHVAH